MTIDDLQRVFKNGNRFEVMTGLSHVNFLNWKRWGYIPLRSQVRIEQLTKGKLKADFNHYLEGKENEERPGQAR